MSATDRIRAIHREATSSPYMEALCDLADAARELPPDGDLQTSEGRALRDRCADALARLDGEDTP